MHDNQPPIEDYLYSVDLWRIKDNNFVIEPFDGSGDLHSYIYTDSDFYRLHPDLADAVRALSEWNWRAKGNKAVYGSDIRNTLDYLTERVVRFTDTVQQLRNVVLITDVAATTHLADYLMLILGDDMNVRTADINGKPVSFVISRECGRKMHVEKHELEEHYPGWEGRYTTAVSLGLNHGELVSHVFEHVPSPIQVPSIATVTFD